jgi:hypothetical protein
MILLKDNLDKKLKTAKVDLNIVQKSLVRRQEKLFNSPKLHFQRRFQMLLLLRK